MNDAATPQTTEASAERKQRGPAANFLPIVRGRLPFLLVHAVRFNEVLTKMGVKDVAVKLGTSVGKVFDIRKGRNFSYITEGYKPTAEDVAAAKAWAEQFGTANAKGLTAQGDADLILKLVAEYEEAGLASPEDIAKMSEARGATRKPRAPKGEATGAATAPASAEELLS